MNFEDIYFYEHTTKKGSKSLGTPLPGGYWVEKEHFDRTWKLITEPLSKEDRLSVNGLQTAEELCNDPEWRQRKCGVRIKMGRCVKYFVDHDILPLYVANPKKKGPRKYRRI